MMYIRPPYRIPLQREDHNKDWSDCEMWGCLPPDSLGLCPDCGTTVSKKDLERDVDSPRSGPLSFRDDDD